ncbi:MAG: hypothetical protein FWE31_05595 [Firmicutes bacterium]|nr:hypothetical protein [Bacillota bacterium]
MKKKTKLQQHPIDQGALKDALEEVRGSLTTIEEELIFEERIIPFYLEGENYQYTSVADFAAAMDLNYDQVEAIENQIYLLIGQIQARYLREEKQKALKDQPPVQPVRPASPAKNSIDAYYDNLEKKK